MSEKNLTQMFGTQQVAIGRTRRAVSVSIGGLGRTRETGRETNANAFPILNAPKRSSRAESTVDPCDSMPTPRLQRSATITIGSLAKSNFTRCGASTVSHFPIPRHEQPAWWRYKPATARNQVAQDSSIFLSLKNYRSCATRPDVTQPLPVFVGRDSGLNDSQGRRERGSDAEADLRRTSLDTSWAPGCDVVRRASIAIEDVVQGLSSITRRTSLSDIYEKAKVRQKQLKRSKIAQIGFQYIFYLFLLVCTYFILVGVPLWKGVVWYIYILFSNKLVVPVGTAVFLGVGFL